MKYIFDHDYHIHSQLSLCSGDPEQTAQRIMQYARDCDLKTICLTDHFWDETVPGASDWYQKQDYPWICQAKPLPKDDSVEFLFGCETDMDKHLTVGLSKEHFDRFDFVIIPTTHLHMTGFTITEEDAQSVEKRAQLWVSRFEGLLNQDLPFKKIGIAHLTCTLTDSRSHENYLQLLNMLPEEDLQRLFAKAADVGVGIELNYSDMCFKDEEANTVLRPYRIAKNCGCRFYCGSDAHHPKTFSKCKEIFERAIDLLGLEESDKFHIVR